MLKQTTKTTKQKLVKDLQYARSKNSVYGDGENVYENLIKLL